MGDNSKIEWTDATWNPVTGCTKVSEGCRNCYAERMHGRFSDDPFSKVTIHHDRLEQPLHWRKPRVIFVCSMGDLFHGCVPPEFISAVFTTMAAARQHTFVVLTKRPARMNSEIGGMKDSGLTLREGCGAVLPNVVLGVSVENQEAADERIPLLLDTPAARRVVSYEPALGPVKFPGLFGLGGVICGGESGPGARPMDVEWARSARDQCAEDGVPFFFKQWGEFTPHGLDCRRVGRKAAGRLLDGRTHDDLPWRLDGGGDKDGEA